jgi:hypothetical protein
MGRASNLYQAVRELSEARIGKLAALPVKLPDASLQTCKTTSAEVGSAAHRLQAGWRGGIGRPLSDRVTEERGALDLAFQT